MSNNRFLNSFTRIPKELFRLNNGPVIRLRAMEGPLRPRGIFDLLTEKGKVKPKALDPLTYEWPNGASMRSNSPTQQRLVRTLRGSTIYIYAVPAGTELPEDLILVHEFKDHYSLQAKKEMSVNDLNAKIMDFLDKKAQCFTKEEWLQRYPAATESD